MDRPDRDIVRRKAAQVFPGHDPADIVAILDRYGVESWERERERVQLALLRISEGSLERLLQWLGYAKTDYRDALAAAEYPSESRAGFTGMGKLSPAQREAIRRKDREAYRAWLEGA